MNKLYIYTIIFIFPVLSSAQVLDGAKLEKSLTGLTGIEKLTALNELHLEFKYRNRNKSRIYAQEAMELAESIDKDTSYINVSLQIGMAHLNIGDCLRADKYLHTSLEHSQSIKINPEMLIDVYFTMGRLFMCKGGRIFGDIMFNKSEINKESYVDLIKEEMQLFNEALIYLYKSLEILKNLNQTSEIKHLKIARTYHYIAQCFGSKIEYEKALEYYLKAYESYKKAGMTKHAAIMLSAIGNLYRAQIQNYHKAIGYTLRAIKENEFSFDLENLSTIKKINEDELYELISFFSNIGFSYYSLSDYENALKYYLNIYKIHKILNDSMAYNDVLNYIGRAYFELKKYDQAIKYYDTALIYSQQFKNKSAEAQSYYNLGLLYSVTNEFQKSIDYYKKSLLFRKEIGRTQDMGYSYQRMAEVYEKSGNFKEADLNYQEALKIADNIQDIELKNSILLKLSVFYEKTGNYQNSLLNYKLYKRISDSLVKQKQNELIIRQQVNFDLESKEKELIRQKEEGIKENQQKFILYSVSSISLITIVFLIILLYYLRYRNRLRREYIQSEQKALRAQMNPHFIFNSLGSIQNFVLKQDADTANDYLAKFSRLIRQVLENSKYNTIPLNQEMDAIKTYVVLEQLRFENKFSFAIDTSPELSLATIEIPPMLIQPFLENAILHGITPLKDKGHLELFINKVSSSRLEIIVEDNGIGRAQAAEINKHRMKHKSTGMKNVEERLIMLSKIHKADFKYHIEDLFYKNGTSAGTKVIMEIPISD
ncbi:MAG: tetratricopeptide repeat protein [Bacteroidales bacterium]|nr:tetratricopeptide repeat protein [Bacteroidales bacterium]